MSSRDNEHKRDGWMQKTKPGKRTSAYSAPKSKPKKKKKKATGNIYEVVRERSRRAGNTR